MKNQFTPLAAQHETGSQKMHRERAGWLTQEDIDRMEPYRPPSLIRSFLNWLDDEPGGCFTMIVLGCFVAGMWFTILLWKPR